MCSLPASAQTLVDRREYSLSVRHACRVILSAAMRAPVACVFVFVAVTIAVVAQAPQPDPGRATFERSCARCHGADGQGGEMGPGITTRTAVRTDQELAALVRDGLPAKGMPASRLGDAEVTPLVAFVRTLRPRRSEAPARVSISISDGTALSAFALNRSADDMQVLADDGTLHLLRKDGPHYRRVTSQVDWPTYHGAPHGNRYSSVDQISRSTVARLAPAWIFTFSDTSRLEVTPIVVDGIMYVTAPNEGYALDAGSGRRIWHFKRPRSQGLAGDAAAGINRGAAVAGHRLFLVTDDARLLALNRFTGDLMWETRFADPRQNYGATSAPLVVGRLVIVGPSGGDEGIRGFVAAFDTDSGKEVWRFWTVPKPGEPGSETWSGTEIDHRCGAAWLTGTYDPDLDTVYWPTGNPCPDYDGSQRQGDNLYTDSIVALAPSTGRLKWHFQYTPHDLWDWDAQQPPVLVDLDWQGKTRKVLLQANRNGFFYVLDRVTGALLLAKPFVKKLTWAREIDARGRPVLIGNQAPDALGTKVCPAVEGATNWFSTAFSAATGLYYVQALEKCSIYLRSPGAWRSGESYYSGATRQVPGEPGQKFLRAIDVRTGEVRWEVPQVGRASSWGGALATAGGLVFFGDDSGALAAVDAAAGTPLWRFDANADWKASPMTYVFDRRQYIAVAAGPNIIAFALR
jgi:alcohol dehydrogenase (cytochrome c)